MVSKIAESIELDRLVISPLYGYNTHITKRRNNFWNKEFYRIDIRHEVLKKNVLYDLFFHKINENTGFDHKLKLFEKSPSLLEDYGFGKINVLGKFSIFTRELINKNYLYSNQRFNDKDFYDFKKKLFKNKTFIASLLFVVAENVKQDMYALGGYDDLFLFPLGFNHINYLGHNSLNIDIGSATNNDALLLLPESSIFKILDINFNAVQTKEKSIFKESNSIFTLKETDDLDNNPFNTDSIDVTKDIIGINNPSLYTILVT